MNHYDELDDEELDYICNYCKKSRKAFFIILGVVTVADKYQIDCKIDREVIKTGWFSKRYEYHITYSGDNDKVMKAIDDMREKCEENNDRINALIRTSCGSGW